VTYGEFGNNIYWQLIANASYNHNFVNTAIDNLYESGGLDISIKDSVDAAVGRILATTRPPGGVAAIVMIGDSAYNNDAADFAAMVQETWTDNNIRIYSVHYVSSLNNCDGNYAQQLKALTNATHGKYYCNNTRENIDAALQDVYLNLTEIAGVNIDES
jgi:hypothetical protein